MCGICGYVMAPGTSSDVERGTLIRMRDTLVHRGPDEEGLFHEAGVGLAHRRLSIVDLASGQQPMFTADGRYTVVYNGEVYNHLALRNGLVRDGAVPVPPPEVLEGATDLVQREISRLEARAHLPHVQERIARLLGKLTGMRAGHFPVATRSTKRRRGKA